jgi:hypothetical protein
VVLPLPRKPVKIMMGVFAAGCIVGMDGRFDAAAAQY